MNWNVHLKYTNGNNVALIIDLNYTIMESNPCLCKCPYCYNCMCMYFIMSKLSFKLTGISIVKVKTTQIEVLVTWSCRTMSFVFVWFYSQKGAGIKGKETVLWGSCLITELTLMEFSRPSRAVISRGTHAPAWDWQGPTVIFNSFSPNCHCNSGLNNVKPCAHVIVSRMRVRLGDVNFGKQTRATKW